MNENAQILIAKLCGAIDSTICKGYSLKKAKQFIQVKAEIFMPNINNETMQSVLKFAEKKLEIEKSLENLKMALFKQRHDVPAIKEQINSCCEKIEDVELEEVV